MPEWQNLFTCRKREAVGNVEADKPLIKLFSP
ncbi:MAG TPA: hypothetical protein DEB17_01335 [Chlorobaculum sp.]|uniref:Uncharacterized protein n=1 Tax=Chlorobaculum tepidum (strain ATCC 49652 / DSM 12025 / NBRC 103806 / TLS) TaxID=194439 RepID=Q8KCF4_CHLTE|nr:hypothetical protein CT1468 [Chlorobaculum tepidum TLS]HBU22642.1 hypothetical protein [Chlorobaculum sp.]